MKFAKKIKLILIIIAILVVGCNKSPMLATPARMATSSAIDQISTPIPNQTVEMSISVTAPSRIKLPSFTMTPTFFATYTTIPSYTLTPTSGSTLPPEQANDILIELYQHNGGCTFPCFWGNILPGYTSWKETRAFLDTLSPNVKTQHGTKTHESLYKVYFPSMGLLDSEENFFAWFTVYDDKITRIISLTDLPLNKVLTDIGKPAEIWLYAENSVFSDTPLAFYTLVLFYPDQGIMLVMDDNSPRGKKISICPGEMSEHRIAFMLWDSRQHLAFSADLLSPMSSLKFEPLEEVVQMSIDMFYETYHDEGNISTCFDWQDPNWP